MPFISEVKDIQVVVQEYAESKFAASVIELTKDKAEGGRGYKHIRRLRRDGNCFYRSFLFQLFEHYALNMKTHETQYKKLIEIVKESKDDLVKNGGYDEIVIEDFYDCFLEALEKLATLEDEFKKQSVTPTYEEYVHLHLLGLLCNHEMANYIIMYARFMAACHLKKNAILFEDFLGTDMATFCMREVEQVDVECDHP